MIWANGGGAGSPVLSPLVDINGASLNRIKRGHRLTYAFGSDTVYLANAATSTALFCLPLDDDITAFRLVLARTPLGVGANVLGAVGRVSSSIGDYVNPTGGSAWSTVTWNAGGSDIDYVNPVAQGGQGNQTTRAVPQAPPTDPFSGSAVFWAPDFSDWIGIQPVGTPVAGSKRALMIRLAYGPGNYLGKGVSLAGWTGVPSINMGNDVAIYHPLGDFVTGTPVIGNPGALLQNSPIIGVQVLSRSPGITIMTVGDSQMGGNGGVAMNYWLNQIWNQWPGVSPIVPMAPAQLSWGGTTSAAYSSVADSMIPAVEPSIIVIEAYTGNDPPNTWWSRSWPRAMMLARKVERLGGVAIFFSTWPEAGGLALNVPAQAPAFTARDNIIHSAGSGRIVIDPISICGTRALAPSLGIMGTGFDGNTVPAFADNPSPASKHQNNAGMAALAAVMMPIIRNLAGV